MSRSPLELLDLPFAFTQQPLLTADKFVREARERGVGLTEVQLEGFSRLHLLRPILGVRRDGRLIAQLARQDHPAAWQVAHWEPSSRWDLEEARREGRLSDSGARPILSRRRRERTVGDITYASTVYLYSPYQLLMLPISRRSLT